MIDRLTSNIISVAVSEPFTLRQGPTLSNKIITIDRNTGNYIINGENLYWPSESKYDQEKRIDNNIPTLWFSNFGIDITIALKQDDFSNKYNNFSISYDRIKETIPGVHNFTLQIVQENGKSNPVEIILI
jgi:hypothetical protein